MLQDYHIVKHRRNWSTIYRCNHYTHYMKVWPKDEIEKEVALYEKLKAAGIPLPSLLWFEIHEDDLGWMKEEAIPGLLYAELFTESYDKHWFVEESILETFIQYQHNHLTGQAQTIWDTSIVADAFSKYEFLYSEWQIDHTLVEACISKIKHDTESEPQGWNHWDHNAYNIFENGVIDLEDSFYGALGYDTITAITQNYRFPYPNGEPWELTRQHVFSKEQILHYLETLSKHDIGINYMESATFGALFLMRGIFVTVQSDSFPLLKTYRYKRLQDAMEAYLNWENMIEYFLKNY